MIVENLSRSQCEAVLSVNHTADLACVRDNRPYVVPISYAFSGSSIYSFSLDGRKIAWMRENKFVSLLVVDHGYGGSWKSVVVSGIFEEFTDNAYFKWDNDFAWKALSKRPHWWDPGSLKPDGEPKSVPVHYIYYSIRIEALTGRSASNHSSAVK
jgi:uncharacterized protein